MVQVFATTELLSDESRAATGGEAAARRDDTRGSLGIGMRAEESQIGLPTAGGARPQQAMVAEGDRDGTSILERLYWSSEQTVMIVKYRRKMPKSR